MFYKIIYENKYFNILIYYSIYLTIINKIILFWKLKELSKSIYYQRVFETSRILRTILCIMIILR